MDQSLQYGEERLLVLADFEPGKGKNTGAIASPRCVQLGYLLKTPLGLIRSFVANPNYVVITRFLVHYILKNIHYFQFFRH